MSRPAGTRSTWAGRPPRLLFLGQGSIYLHASGPYPQATNVRPRFHASPRSPYPPPGVMPTFEQVREQYEPYILSLLRTRVISRDLDDVVQLCLIEIEHS